jgi:hypothetical protein
VHLVAGRGLGPQLLGFAGLVVVDDEGGRVEDAGRRSRITEVVLVPGGAQLGGELLRLRAPALARVVRRVPRERERPPVADERAGDGCGDPRPAARAGDERGGYGRSGPSRRAP